MTPEEAQVSTQIERIRALIPPGKDARDYLGQLLDEHQGSASGDTPMGVVSLPMSSPAQMYASARVTAESLDDPAEVVARPEGIVDLGVIEWVLRPALLLRDGRFEPTISGPWAHLAANAVQQVACLVCRIDLAINGGVRMHLGTGFVAGRDAQGQGVVMTNAHVIEGAYRYGWPTTSGLELACDFACEAGGDEGPISPLAREVQIHPCHDLALVYLPPVPAPAPEPLAAAGTPPDPTVGLVIGVLGHPSFNSDLDPFPKLFGFGAAFGVKRFSPGQVRSLGNRTWREQDVDVLLHDATTLSGSSGSCIVDLGSGRVVGLHFGGWPLSHKKPARTSQGDVLASLFESNGAVPLWTLKDDPFLDEISWVS
jgi:hypothetical protein